MVAKLKEKSEAGINLLFLIYDLERGGPELRLLDMQKHFPANFRINICVTSTKTALLSDFLDANAKITIIPVKRGYLEIHKAWSIYRQFRNEKISIINAFDLKEYFLAAFIKIFCNWRIKTVFNVVESFDHFQFRQKTLLRLVSKTADHFLCNSAYLKSQLENFSIATGKVQVIKNGVDTAVFDKNRCGEREQIDIGEDKKHVIIGTIANFRKEKNYPFLIKAFSILKQKHPNLRLLCVGGGPLLQEMKNLAELLGVKNQIVFTGYSGDIISYLRLMDLFVLCSERESFPNALLQAMSMEVPVLSANVGGCLEIVEHGKNGMTYPTNDSEAFVSALKIMIQNRSFASKLAENGRKTILDHFSLKRMISDYADFYKVLSMR